MAINGGPHFKFSPAISLFVHCIAQEEVDYYWEKLSEGGEEQMCGWLNDKFGLTWEVVPKKLLEFLQDKDHQKSKRVMDAMLQMKKLDINILQKAYEQ